MDDFHYVFHLAIACLLSIRCWAYFDLLLLYLTSRRCSWNLTLNGLPVCPVYFILHSGHVSWYTPFLSYLLWGVSCFIVRRFSIVLSVVNAIFTIVFLNSFVTNLVCLPTYVNFAHICFWLFCLCLFSLLNFSKEEASYMLLTRSCKYVNYEYLPRYLNRHYCVSTIQALQPAFVFTWPTHLNTEVNSPHIHPRLMAALLWKQYRTAPTATASEPWWLWTHSPCRRRDHGLSADYSCFTFPIHWSINGIRYITHNCIEYSEDPLPPYENREITFKS